MNPLKRSLVVCAIAAGVLAGAAVPALAASSATDDSVSGVEPFIWYPPLPQPAPADDTSSYVAAPATWYPPLPKPAPGA